jgi:hypothetical protein
VPARFDKMGIAFQYPENWTLDEADAVAGCRSVTVSSPGGAFWSVAIHPATADPASLAQGVVDAMKDEYKEVEVDEVHDTLVGHELAGYDMSFYYLDFVNSAQIRSLRVKQKTYTIFCQAEDREFQKLAMVFRALTASLLGELGV